MAVDLEGRLNRSASQGRFGGARGAAARQHVGAVLALLKVTKYQVLNLLGSPGAGFDETQRVGLIGMLSISRSGECLLREEWERWGGGNGPENCIR